MLKKRVTIFGRSVPLAAIILALAVTVAFAAWLFISMTANISVTAQDFGPFILSPDPPGPRTNAAPKCAYVDAGGDVWTMTGTSLVPGEYCGINSSFLNDGPTTGYGQWEIVSGDPRLLITSDCNVEILAGATGNMGFTYELDEAVSVPGDIINGIQIRAVFSPDAVVCP